MFIPLLAVAIAHFLWSIGRTWPIRDPRAAGADRDRLPRRRPRAPPRLVRRRRRDHARRRDRPGTCRSHRRRSAAHALSASLLGACLPRARRRRLHCRDGRPARRSSPSARSTASIYSPLCLAPRRRLPRPRHPEAPMKSLNGPLRIGIGGPVGSGKTTLCEMLLKAHARPLLDGGRHQRHLHQGRRADPRARAGHLRGPHRRRRDRRLPAYRDPRGRLAQPQRHRRAQPQIPRPRHHPDRDPAATTSPRPSRPISPTSRST